MVGKCSKATEIKSEALRPEEARPEGAGADGAVPSPRPVRLRVEALEVRITPNAIWGD